MSSHQGSYSNWNSTNSSVPHDSILGLIPLLIFVNDMPARSDMKYIDNFKLYVSPIIQSEPLKITFFCNRM